MFKKNSCKRVLCLLALTRAQGVMKFCVRQCVHNFMLKITNVQRAFKAFSKTLANIWHRKAPDKAPDRAPKSASKGLRANTYKHLKKDSCGLLSNQSFKLLSVSPKTALDIRDSGLNLDLGIWTGLVN